MYPFSHFLFALFSGEVFVKLGFLNQDLALLVAVIAVLIDIDHFVFYSFKHQDWDLKHAWNAAVSGKEEERTFIHHWIGFLIITIVIAGLYFYNFTVFLVLALAYYSHMFLDYAHLNVLKIKGIVSEEIDGYVLRIHKYEVLFDVLVLVGILWLVYL
jgi:hypothetical protein